MKAIDSNPATQWDSAGPPLNNYPHYITLTLDKTYVITSVAINETCGDWASTGSIYTISNQTVPLGGWSIGSPQNVTIPIDSIATYGITFRGATSGGFPGYMCVRELWAFGYSSVVVAGPSGISLLVLLILGLLWLGFFVAGTGLKTGFFVILSGVSALLFAITAWTTTNDIPSSILLFAAAAFTLIWSVRVIMAERSAAG